MYILQYYLVPSTLFIAAASAQSFIGGQSGQYTDIPRWCGKPYQPGYPNYDPTGELEPPKPSPSPMLLVQVQPRYSIYDSSEKYGEFIVDAGLSYYHGQSWTNATPTDAGGSATAAFGMLDFDIRLEDNDKPLVSNSVVVNTTSNVVTFGLDLLRPRLEPYNVVLYGAPPSSYANESYTATTEIYFLPAKYNGSTVKVDNLYGGLAVANHVTNYSFVDILPFGFYTDCGGYLNYSLANVTAYKDLGLNAINPVCSFLDGDLENVFDWMDELDLWYQYDMRHVFDNGLNTTQLIEALPPVKDRSNLLSWYTADEPDGWQYALNQTKIAYDILKQMDPYHPTALVLNCDNYYFEEYSSGADYIMEDAYPVGINATYSKWNTTCNETYGDCGCDDCIGELQDVSNRLDDFFDYQLWLGETQKPLWAVLQAFSGEGYWARDPTPDETWAMMLISFNHGAKGIMSWTFPASNTLEQAHGDMAKIATTSPVSDFLIGAQPVRVIVPGHELVDVAYWTVNGTIMLGFANLDYADSSEEITIELPMSIGGVTSQPWGSVDWVVEDGKLSISKLQGLATSFVLLCASRK